MYDKDFLSKVTILYVEDEESTLQEFKEVFNHFFKEVLTAHNGSEALIIYKDSIENQKEIDVIISDINMPIMNGIELLEEVRSISNDIPFIFTTAFNDSAKLLKAIKYKVTSYVIKPVNLKELILEIQQYAKQINIEDRYKFGTSRFSEYLNSIDKVAMILKTDSNDCITYANESFLEILKYQSEDIIGKKYSSLRYENEEQGYMQSDTKFGNIWREKLKLKTKERIPLSFYNITLPLYDERNEKVQEYYRVSFLLSNKELIKNHIQKKVKNNLTVNEIIDELKTQISKYKHLDMLEESLAKEKVQKQTNIEQIQEYKKIRDSI